MCDLHLFKDKETLNTDVYVEGKCDDVARILHCLKRFIGETFVDIPKIKGQDDDSEEDSTYEGKCNKKSNKLLSYGVTR
jgi:hypothetical protein